MKNLLTSSGRVLLTLVVVAIAIAVGWQLYDLTSNPLDLGLVGLVQFVPVVLLMLIAVTSTISWSSATPALAIVAIALHGATSWGQLAAQQHRLAHDLVALQLAGLQLRAEGGEIPDVVKEALAELQRSGVSGAGLAFGHILS